jgi:parallel beta-helix repeat protein
MLDSENARADTEWPAGPITGNTVWTEEDSPYNVDGMVTVENNAKLKVEPGVEVRFNSENDPNYANYGIVVYGVMNAEDATFTRHPDNTYNVAWAGITFEESKKTSDVDSCTIEYADAGVHTKEGSRLDFTDSTICWGNVGIFIEESSELKLKGHEIYEAQIGIYIVDSQDITVEDATVIGCSDIGILVDYGESQSHDISILNSDVKANSVTGIEFRSVYDSEISNCDVSENIDRNILLISTDEETYTHHVLLSNNLIESYTSTWYFTSNGIEIYGGSDIEVFQCTILDNNMFGMYVSDTEVTVSETEIAYSTHHYGLFAWNTQLTLLNNNFHENSYSVWAAGGCAVFSSQNSYSLDFMSVVVHHSRLYMEYDIVKQSQQGVWAYDRSTVTLYGCRLKGSEISAIAIRLMNSDRLRMTECTVSHFYYGVQVGNTPETFIKDNVFLHNRNVGISIGTNFMDIRVRIESNLFNHGGGGILVSGGLYTVHCTGEIIKDNIFNNVEYGIWLHYCNVPVENNKINHASTYGIWIKVASPTVRYNSIRNSNIGIYVEWWSAPLLQNNKINNCLWGIYVAYQSQATIVGNQILTGDIGIACDIGCYVTVRWNYIQGFSEYGIIIYYAGADITGNVIRKCTNGIYFYMSYGSVTGNYIVQNEFGVTLHSSKVTVKSNTFRRNGTDIRVL